jgi:hypothetical protein
LSGYDLGGGVAPRVTGVPPRATLPKSEPEPDNVRVTCCTQVTGPGSRRRRGRRAGISSEGRVKLEDTGTVYTKVDDADASFPRHSAVLRELLNAAREAGILGDSVVGIAGCVGAHPEQAAWLVIAAL